MHTLHVPIFLKYLVRSLPAWGVVLGLTVSVRVSAASADTVPSGVRSKMKVGIVQLALSPTISASGDRAVAKIAAAAQRGARVVILPEAAISGNDGNNQVLVDETVARIRAAAKQHNVYVLCGVNSFLPARKKAVNWMFVAAPDGSELFRCNKIYDQVNSPLPGTFRIDGVVCNTMICADRWLRGVEEIPVQEGAQVTFELSCNSSREWVAPFGWYWYVPRALRNNAWVVFANTGNQVAGAVDSFPEAELRHGHSAVVGPDGVIRAAAQDDAATILVTEIDVDEATLAEAKARSTNPVLEPFWAAGVKLQKGENVPAPAFKAFDSPEAEITLAASQLAGNIGAMEAAIRLARERKADVIVFPARAVPESALRNLQTAARDNHLVVVVGAEHEEHGAKTNAAFVFGPDGSLLTRYDQISASAPFQPGADAGAMWFRVKGVPAVVTIGRDGLWSELAELASVAGARIHIHLENDPANNPAAHLRRLQVWSNLASYLTFSATVNVVDSVIWDDLRGKEERHGDPVPHSGPLEVLSPFSANLLVQTFSDSSLIVATRKVARVQPNPPRIVSLRNPQSGTWLRLGATLIQPRELK